MRGAAARRHADPPPTPVRPVPPPYSGVRGATLAWKTFRTPLRVDGSPPARTARAFRDGLIVNLSNPKVILFILALLPQFVDPSSPIVPQVVLLGVTSALVEFCVLAGYARLAHAGRRFGRLRERLGG